MPTAEARLLHRGEQFEITEGPTRYQGQCFWCWEQRPGESRTRAYPLELEVNTLRRCGLGRLLPLSRSKQRRLAQLAQQLLAPDGDTTKITLFERR